MSVTITGLDKLQRDLEEMQRAFSALDGEIGKVSFNRNDPESVNRAIQDMESAVDAKAAAYGHLPIVKKATEEAKKYYATAIREKAEAIDAQS